MRQARGGEGVHRGDRQAVRQEGGRDHDQGLGATALRRPQLRGDAVPGREASGHVQAEAEAVLRLGLLVVGLRRRQPGVERLQPVRGDPDALVHDRQHYLAAVQQAAGRLHLGAGRGERRRVLQQLGQHVRDVVGRMPGDLDEGRQHGEVDPLVALDLADRGPHDVDQRHRGPGTVGVLLAGKDQQVLVVAAHHGRQVVQLEEGLQPVRVLLLGLQLLDDRELALDEAEGAQRQRDRGRRHDAPVFLQALAQPVQLGLQAVPAGGQGLVAADEAATVGVQAGDLGVQGDRLLPDGVEVADDLGELVVAAGEADRLDRALGRREPGRAAPQHGQRPGERAGDGRGDADGDEEQHADRGDQQLQPGHVVVAQGGERGGPLPGEGGFHGPHAVDAGGEGGADGGGVGGLAVGRGEGGALGEPLEVVVGRLDLGAGDGGGQGLAYVGPGGAVEVVERGLLPYAGPLGGGAELVGDGGAGGLLAAGDGQRGEEQSAGGRGLLHGLAQRGQRAGGGEGVLGARRGLLGEPVARCEEFRDDAGVGLVGGEGAALAVDGLGADGLDAAEGLGERFVGLGLDLGELPVGEGGALLYGRLALAAGAALGDVLDDGVTLVTEEVREGEGVLGLLGEGDQRLGVVQLTGGRDHGGGTGREDGETGDGDTDDQPAAHADAASCGGGSVGGGAVLPRPLLLHRCSQSCTCALARLLVWPR